MLEDLVKSIDVKFSSAVNKKIPSSVKFFDPTLNVLRFFIAARNDFQTFVGHQFAAMTIEFDKFLQLGDVRECDIAEKKLALTKR